MYKLQDIPISKKTSCYRQITISFPQGPPAPVPNTLFFSTETVPCANQHAKCSSGVSAIITTRQA